MSTLPCRGLDTSTYFMMIAVPRPKISSAEPHTEHRWRCSLLAGGSYQRALNKSGCIYVERCAKVTYLWLRVFFFQNLGEVCGFANRRILRNGTKPSWATGQRVKYGAPATIFWRHRRSYGLNLANWVFFFSKYGEFIHFCPQETFCKIHRPFFFPSPSGEISPRLWVGYSLCEPSSETPVSSRKPLPAVPDSP